VYEIVMIGTSWGGLNALSRVVAGLPSTFALPLVVVQHRSPDAPGFLAELLQAHTGLCVVEVVQDPATAEGAAMPRAALRAVPKAHVVPLDRIASQLIAIAPPRPPAEYRVRAPLT
jgi:chemotaxis response regulator CheB